MSDGPVHAEPQREQQAPIEGEGVVLHHLAREGDEAPAEEPDQSQGEERPRLRQAEPHRQAALKVAQARAAVG